MKKGQMEIIGLLMVVILLMSVVLIALWFILKPKQDILTPQRQAIEVNSILLTLIKTTYEINTEIDIKDKIIECSQNDLVCPEVEGKITAILNEILKNKEYFLEIKDNSGDIIGPIIEPPNIPRIQPRSLNNPCSDNKIKTKGSVLVDAPRQIGAILVICTIGGGIL